MSGNDSGIANRRIPSFVWIANPPFTPGSQATIVLLICLGLDGEFMADEYADQGEDWKQTGGGDHDCNGVHTIAHPSSL